MTNRETGNAFERRVKKYLESVGFTVERTWAKAMWMRGRTMSIPRDFFHAADLIAVHPNRPFTLFVQTHAGSTFAPRKVKLEAIPWNLNQQRIQIWCKISKLRGGIQCHMLLKNEEPKQWKEIIFRMKDGEEPIGVLA